MSYYEPGEALDRCRAADKHWVAGDYGRFFEEYMNIAVETSYPLAECQVGFCYLECHGVEKDVERRCTGQTARRSTAIWMRNTISQGYTKTA